jgi:histone H3/H4
MTGERPLEHLADALWSERRVVEYLLYKLLSARFVLAADERRFVAHALEEVQRSVEALKAAEIRRGAAVQELAQVWHVSGEDLTLTEIAQRAPEPMRTVFRDHQGTFREMIREIEQVTAANRRIASDALSEVREAIDALAGHPVTDTMETSEDRVSVPTRARTS